METIFFYYRQLIHKAKIVGRNYLSRKQLYYIVDNSNWVIRHEGNSITQNLKNISSSISTSPVGIRNAILHYGSIYNFITEKGIRRPHKSNKVIISWYHFVHDDNILKLLPEAIEKVDVWHTSCSVTANKLEAHGVPKEKLFVIPLGVDLNTFYPGSLSEKANIRKKLNIDDDYIVIGSFQKDGNGWEDGIEPKLIKGPDVFCESIKKIAQKIKIYVLLTGPARGYVKNELKKIGVPYKHLYLNDQNDVSKYYRALDLYIVSSRVEGGPKAILESLASGVPLISTKVGMAIDIIQHNQNGILVDVEDSNEIALQSINLLLCTTKKQHIIADGLETVKSYDWSIIADRYYNEIYNKVL